MFSHRRSVRRKTKTNKTQDARGLSSEDSDELMQALSSLFKVMSDRGSGAALDRPFASPYHWAGFQVSDRGGGDPRQGLNV